ncbi:MAG TPA: LamG-like jellyroll fold domain-containing protein [Candidatus Saccharimonadales bacterium]|nr:LamG-like jellyroll fold domain-containing protein [Candidatus Saccharimonadales bacterium]
MELSHDRSDERDYRMKHKNHFTCLRSIALVLLGSLAFAGVASGALSLNGTNQYVTFGLAKSLGSPTFTLETWFNWTGGGVPGNTGNGGIWAIPLITKMTAEDDGDERDGNYFLGIRGTDGVLIADMEEGARAAAPGSNHPVLGVTPVTSNVWHHAAVTYNGTTWSLFLDGYIETTLTVGQPPRSDTIQHAALGSSITSTGVPQGFFSGTLDEARIWNYARTASQISSNRNVQITSAPGLIGRWSLTETNGSLAHDTSGSHVDGRLVNGPVWRNNNRAAADIVTPIKLVVVDQERTAILRQVEAQRMPPIFRFRTSVAQQAEQDFRNAFLLTREKFLANLEEVYPKRPPNWKAPTDVAFNQFIANFQTSNKDFPASTDVIRKWAEGHYDSATQSNLAVKLAAVATRYIRPEGLRGDALAGPATVRFYSLTPSNTTPSLELVENQGLSCSRASFLSLAQARADLIARFPAKDQPLANYLAGFLKENCVFDQALTQESRARHAGSLFATDQFQPGQLIVKKGQVIDAKIKAVLDELKAQKAASDMVKARVAAEQAKAERALRVLQQQNAISEFKSEHFSQENRWLFGGLLIIAMTSSLAVVRLTRFRRSRTLLPAIITRSDDPMLAGGTFSQPPDGVDAADWKERALFAEQRAARANEVLRAGLLPQLSQWLKQKITRRLIADRQHLMRIQYAAELELAELEQRLAKIQAPLEARLKIYEDRIVELERQLAIKGEESRELIKAKIASTRKKIEREQQRNPTTGI